MAGTYPSKTNFKYLKRHLPQTDKHDRELHFKGQIKIQKSILHIQTDKAGSFPLKNNLKHQKKHLAQTDRHGWNIFFKDQFKNSPQTDRQGWNLSFEV